MQGILDLDVLCLTEILKFLNPLDLCSLRQSCTQLRDIVENHFHSLYFAREQWLDLTDENIRHASRILKNFGKLVRRLKVGEETRGHNLLPDVILTNCGTALKGLSLDQLRLYEIDMEKFAGVLDNFEILELLGCDGDQKSFTQILLGPQYPNLTTLSMKASIIEKTILEQFFNRKRSIKKLISGFISSDILPLIVRNASEIEELYIHPDDGRNLNSLARLNKLKRLGVICFRFDQNLIMQLFEDVSLRLKMLSLVGFKFSTEFCSSLSKLTNLKELRLRAGTCSTNDTKSLEMLGSRLKLESLMLVDCADFPYRSFLASACKWDNFRTLYVYNPFTYSEVNKFIDALSKDAIEGRGHRCFVSGDRLSIYLHEHTFNDMNEDNLQSIEKFGNIKILPCNDDVFWTF